MARLARVVAAVSSAPARWLPSVGLEIHAQILSRSKLFSDGPTQSKDKPPNTTIALFDIALPGTLPVLNVSCVKAGVLTALAVSADVNMTSFFDRKHYFYPDLPAGYQITQKRVPLATGGSLMVPLLQNNNSFLTVRLKQVQLEQDSGKITYGEVTETGGRETLVDYNRAGVGLMEIVTEPDLKNGTEASSFVRELRQLLLALGTCDGNIQDGSLRVDANVSVRRPDSSSLGIRTEIKNISGFRSLTRAVDREILRHIQVLEDGGEIDQETRSFDERKGITVATRGKTEQQDYCFMAEHDLPPLVLYSDSSPAPPSPSPSEDQVINVDRVLETMPELPAQLRRRLCQDYGLSHKQVQVLMGEDGASSYFEEVLKCCPVGVSPHSAHSWITSELYGLLDNRIRNSPVSPEQLASILAEINRGNMSGSQGKKTLKQMAAGDKRLAQIIASDMAVLTEEEMEQECANVLESYSEQVSQYQSGKSKVLGYFVGQVMSVTRGRGGDPQTIKTILLRKLNQSKR